MAKMGKAIGDSLGVDADRCFFIDILATQPAFQGRGLGGKLVKAVTDKVFAHRPLVIGHSLWYKGR